MKKSLRYKLLLGKLRVLSVTKAIHGYDMAIDLPGLGRLICPVPTHADVRAGDILSLYTEILSSAPIEGPTDDKLSRPSI